MKRNLIFGFVLAGVAVVFFSLGSFIMAQEQGPEQVSLPGGSYGKVEFSHTGHAASAACKDCHHKEETPVAKCDSCHNSSASVSSKNAYHKNCIDCHRKAEKGPTACMDCHKKG